MQNSTTEIRVHRQQRCAAALQQVQANTLAQLGSNPLKPLLRATADPTAPSGASEKWVYFRKKNLYILVCCPETGKEQGHGDGGFLAHQELLVLSLSACPSVNPEDLVTVSKCIISYSGNKQPNAFEISQERFPPPKSIPLLPFSRKLNTGGRALFLCWRHLRLPGPRGTRSIYSTSYGTTQPRSSLSAPSRG